MHTPSLSKWRKSAQSTANGACVEVARLGPSIGLRDSKDPGSGHLAIPAEAFAALLTRIKHGEPTT